MRPRAPAGLWPAAVAAAGAHLAAGLLARTFVLPGSPGEPLAERAAYVAAAGWGWRLGWLGWIVAGVTLIAVLRRARRRLHADPLAGAAVAAAGAALAVDAPCDAGQAWLLPRLAASDLALFQEAERWLTLGGYTVANGLYSVAALLLTLAVARQGRRALLFTGLPLAAAGLWLAGIGAAGSFAHTEAAAGVTVALCVLWPLHLAWLYEPWPAPRAEKKSVPHSP